MNMIPLKISPGKEKEIRYRYKNISPLFPVLRRWPESGVPDPPASRKALPAASRQIPLSEPADFLSAFVSFRSCVTFAPLSRRLAGPLCPHGQSAVPLVSEDSFSLPPAPVPETECITALRIMDSKIILSDAVYFQPGFLQGLNDFLPRTNLAQLQKRQHIVMHSLPVFLPLIFAGIFAPAQQSYRMEIGMVRRTRRTRCGHPVWRTSLDIVQITKYIEILFPAGRAGIEGLAAGRPTRGITKCNSWCPAWL